MTILGFTHTIVVALSMISMPALLDENAHNLGLNLVQIGWIWGFGFLTGIVTVLIGGALSDPFGTKITPVLHKQHGNG
jgi:MFS family permease